MRKYLELVPLSAAWLLGFILLPVPSNAQSSQWAWMNGPQTPQQSQYGTLGTAAPSNLPGNRTSAVSWTDNNGNLWLFGGDGQDAAGRYGILNDMWEYNPSTSEWSWVGGSNSINAPGVVGIMGTPNSQNVPSSRYGAVGWTDAKGNLWLFGGDATLQTDAAILNDLWEFNPSTNEWAWMGGSSNIALCANNQCSGVYGKLGVAASSNLPEARMNATSWTDGQGDLWLFGGSGYDSNGVSEYLNDLWKFDPIAGEWTWISGSSSVPSCSSGECGAAGVYGSLGASAVGNVPGSRSAASGWIDGAGNLWLFGGLGFDSAETFGLLDDIWKFNPSSDEWIWMGGSNTNLAVCSAGSPDECGASGVYGTLGTSAAANFPGARQGPAGWTDAKGNLWLFGGNGIDANGKWGYLDDLWKYSPSTNAWTWMNGSNTVSCVTTYCGQPGVYGTLKLASPENSPGGRQFAATWTDPKGNFWLFGGTGVNLDEQWNYFPDLWEFQPNSIGLPVVATPTIYPSSGTYNSWITVTINDISPVATIYYTIDGNPPSIYSGPITVSSSETVAAFASANGYANSSLATANYVASLPQAAPPTFSVSPGTYGAAQTVAIASATPGATIYYAIGATPTPSSAKYTGPIIVSTPEVLKAIAVANNYLNSPIGIAAYNIGSNTAAQWTWMGGSNAVPACTGCGQLGWYGPRQTFATANVPGARSNPMSWTDSKGNLWLFGGAGTYLYNDLWEYTPSIGQWAWMSGNNTIGASLAGVYGALGTPAVGNTPGGRISGATWIDSQGNLWLFGGHGDDAYGEQNELNDLWKYSPATTTWTWMGGNSTLRCVAANACQIASGVYGILGTFAPGNIPGGRSQSTSWTDGAGNFWLYGGLGEDSLGVECYLDDLWEFNTTKNEWAWMGGNRLCANYMAGYLGNYDTVGVPDAENLPGSLADGLSWTDSSGNLWLFGGSVWDTAGDGELVNDMWEFSPSLNEWLFASANSLYAPMGSGLGVYSTMGSWSANNSPGERSLAMRWTDSAGNFWLFGGTGINSTLTPLTMVNDLWEFKPAINEWAWMGGSNTTVCLLSTSGLCYGHGQAGVYGAAGTPSPGNAPGSRSVGVTWTDNAGNLWLFGGYGYDAQGNLGYLNDLWEYGIAGPPATTPALPTTTPAFSLAAGSYLLPQQLAISEQTAGATIYYTTDGTPPSSNASIYTGPISLSSSETVEAIAIASGRTVSGLAIATYSSISTANPTFSVPAGTYGTPQSVSISDVTAGAVIYYTTDGTTPATNSTRYSGPITISSTETIRAIAVAPGYGISSVVSTTYTISLPSDFSVSTSPSSLTVTAGQSGTVNISVTPANGFNAIVAFSCSGLPSGTSCRFSPPTLTPLGAPASTTLTVNTSTSTVALIPSSGRLFLGSVLALSFCFYRRRLGGRLYLSILVMAAVLGLGLINGCGGATSSSGSATAHQPVMATVTLTARSGFLQHNTSFSLTVN